MQHNWGSITTHWRLSKVITKILATLLCRLPPTHTHPSRAAQEREESLLLQAADSSPQEWGGWKVLCPIGIEEYDCCYMLYPSVQTGMVWEPWEERGGPKAPPESHASCWWRGQLASKPTGQPGGWGWGWVWHEKLLPQEGEDSRQCWGRVVKLFRSKEWRAGVPCWTWGGSRHCTRSIILPCLCLGLWKDCLQAKQTQLERWNLWSAAFVKF